MEILSSGKLLDKVPLLLRKLSKPTENRIFQSLPNCSAHLCVLLGNLDVHMDIMIPISISIQFGNPSVTQSNPVIILDTSRDLNIITQNNHMIITCTVHYANHKTIM